MESHDIVYAYVVRTVDIDNGRLEQTGSGPNFAGDRITLTTCKHQMRAYKTPEDWAPKTKGGSKGAFWIAGFTSSTKAFEGFNWLVYLMKVGESYASQYDIVMAWRRQHQAAALNAKFAHLHKLGDIFEPIKDLEPHGARQFEPSSYKRPIEGHRHQNHWDNDINYLWRSIRHPALLVGDRRYSYIWTRPMIRRPKQARFPRGNPQYSQKEFLNGLET